MTFPMPVFLYLRRCQGGNETRHNSETIPSGRMARNTSGMDLKYSGAVRSLVFYKHRRLFVPVDLRVPCGRVHLADQYFPSPAHSRRTAI